MLTFALDSSQHGVCLALFDETGFKATLVEELEGTASTLLLAKIEALFNTASCALSDVQRVVFCHGPGSFTSLRIALATLTGLFLFAPDGQNLPVIVGSSLLLRCLSAPAVQTRPVVTLMRAGRQRVYFGCRHPNRGFSEAALSVEAAAEKITSEEATFYQGDGMAQLPPYVWQKLPASNLGQAADAPNPHAFLAFLQDPAIKTVPCLAEVRLNYLLEPDIG